MGLEDGAEEQGSGRGGHFFRVAQDFDRVEALEFGDGEGVDGGGDGVPLGGVGEGEGEVALDGLEAGEVVGGDVFEREGVEGGEVELGEVDGLAEFAAVGFCLGKFAEVGDGGVVEQGGGGASGLEPGWGFGGEGEGRGAAGEGEEGEQGFDGAFELEDGGVLRGVAGLRGCAGEAEGELGGFDDVVDEGLSADGAGEDLALLEEADVFYVAVEVVGEHGEHAGNERGTEKRGLFGEGVFHGDWVCWRWRRGTANPHVSDDGTVANMGHPVRRRRRVGVGLGGEGAGDGFAVAEGEEAGADGGFGGGGGMGDDDAGGGEGVGEAVVAVDASDLFDEIDLALEVETPGGELD